MCYKIILLNGHCKCTLKFVIIKYLLQQLYIHFIHNGPDLFSSMHVEFKKSEKFTDLFSCARAVHAEFFTFPETPVHQTIQNGHHVVKPVILQKNIVEISQFRAFSCIYLLSGRKVNWCDLVAFMGLLGKISMK